MEIFHEGLPGSGKSYEAMSRHIIPALQAGREVWAYIEGINHDRVAEAAELPVETVRELLHPVSRDDVPRIAEVAGDNSLVVLDEAQNFWPNGRQKLPPDITKFITEHRHRGMDILLMGQDMRDVHALWRRRVSQRVVFNKLDALGAERRYSVTVYKATAPERFEKVSNSIGTYDPKYFGTYASHVSGDINTANYKDARASLLNTPGFKYVLPAAALIAVWGAFKMWGFFHADKPASGPSKAASAPAPAVPAPMPVRASLPAPKGYVQTLNETAKPRLGGYYAEGGRTRVIIEWWRDGVVVERLDDRQLSVIGVDVVIRERMALVLGQWVTAWPLQPSAAPPAALPAVALPGA